MTFQESGQGADYEYEKDAPILGYHPGCHGNLLAKCLSIAAGVQEDFDLWRGRDGAHNHRDHTHRLVRHTHYDDLMDQRLIPGETVPLNPHLKDFKLTSKNIWCHISIEPTDYFSIHQHNFIATGELGFNLLHPNLCYEMIPENEKWRFGKSSLEKFETTQDGFREFWKKMFTSTNGMFSVEDQVYKEFSIQNIFQYKWFYNREQFCAGVEDLLDTLGHKYVCDVGHHIDTLKHKRQYVYDAEHAVLDAFSAWKNGNEFDMSNFNLFQQAYMDRLLEDYVGKELESCYNMGYPKNTRDIEIREAWYD